MVKLFEYKHFKIIFHYYFHMHSSFIVSPYYKLTQFFFSINGIIDHIACDVMDIVPPSTIRGKYLKTKSQQNREILKINKL